MEATKKQTKRELTIQFFTSKSERVENYKDQILIFEYTSNGFPCAAILHKRETKPSLNYRFQDEAGRTDFLIRQKQFADREAERAEISIKKGIEAAEKMNVGTILYSSWGYEQTNVDFYIIVERVNNTVTLQEIGGIRKYDYDMAGKVSPDASKKIGEPFKKRINKYGHITLTSFSHASIYNGVPKYFSTYA